MRLHNSLTGRVEDFVPAERGRVRMYHCGPTVYKRQHIGNFRAFTVADLLRRTFEFQGLSVHQVMNITDVGHLTEDDVADASGEDKLQ
jgi:cysteinyl-tRNA synthetase